MNTEVVSHLQPLQTVTQRRLDNFGPFEPQRAPHGLLVRHMMSHWHWTVDAINDWLCNEPAEPTSICQTMLAKAAPAGQDRAHDHALLQHPTQRPPSGDAARP